MIARSWHGRVPAAKADAYHDYLLVTGVPGYAATPGNRGVYVFRRIEGDVAHYLITSLWDSVDAIKRFAGEDYERAKYYPQDDDYLLEREPLVTHHDVLDAPRAPKSGVWLLFAALVGLIVPNGYLVSWLATDFHGLAAVMQDKLAVAFVFDALLALMLLALYFARAPIGRISWRWFVVLSLIGGLGFSLPLYWWLNTRPSRPARAAP